MKTLGIIGGISYHSTAVYYRRINQLINERLGGHSAAKLVLYSVNYDDFKKLQAKDDWRQIEIMLGDIAVKLENAGADCILISCNAVHLIADSLINRINVPFIHIADAMAQEIRNQQLNKVALIGTRITMENTFFSDRLKAVGIETILPEANEREFIHHTILTELAQAKFRSETKSEYIGIINNLAAQGAQAVVFGCTEIGLLLSQGDTAVKIFDTTDVHIRAAVEFAIGNTNSQEIEK